VQGALQPDDRDRVPDRRRDVQFESGTLGSQIPATGSLQWQTPSNLARARTRTSAGFHPFMRGAFRVKP
jgi:hypothetical protein